MLLVAKLKPLQSSATSLKCNTLGNKCRAQSSKYDIMEYS